MKRAVLLSSGVFAILGVAALVLVGPVGLDSGQTSPVTESASVSKTANGVLDGMTFKGRLGPSGATPDVEDQWVFDNGMFVSQECERRCSYPPRPYFSRQVGTSTEFISVTECPGKDATIVWRGSVEGTSIRGVATWTMERWYWTIERTFAFEGERVDASRPIATDQPSR